MTNWPSWHIKSMLSAPGPLDYKNTTNVGVNIYGSNMIRKSLGDRELEWVRGWVFIGVALRFFKVLFSLNIYDRK